MGRNYGHNEQPTLANLLITQESRILLAIIDSVDIDNYTCSIHFANSQGVRNQVPLPLYYNSVAGWSRLIPEEGTMVKVAFLPGFKAEILSYYTDPVSKAAAQGYAQSQNLFRDLVPGEQDSMSSGKAGWWETSEGRFLLTGGPAYLELNQRDYEAALEAGTITLRTPQADDWANVKLGTVKREVNGFSTIITKDGVDFSSGGVELKEFSVSVAWDPSSYQPNEQGRKLAQLSLGHVVDESGAEEKWETSSLPLRARLRAFNKANTFTTDITIDEDGNLGITTPITATRGILLQPLGGPLEVRSPTFGINFHGAGVQFHSDTLASLSSTTTTTIGSAGSISIIGEKEMQIFSPTLDVSGAYINVGSAISTQISSGVDTSISGDTQASLISKIKVLLSSPEIMLGDGATLHVVLETFLDLFNTHTHPGVKSGEDVSAPPLQQATSAHRTQITVAE